MHFELFSTSCRTKFDIVFESKQKEVFRISVPTGVLTIQRLVLESSSRPEWNKSQKKLVPIHITSEKKIEDVPNTLQVDFANAFIVSSVEYGQEMFCIWVLFRVVVCWVKDVFKKKFDFLFVRKCWSHCCSVKNYELMNVFDSSVVSVSQITLVMVTLFNLMEITQMRDLGECHIPIQYSSLIVSDKNIGVKNPFHR